ncbi:DUF4265 domain-containing protein [Sorangium cellulosum]|uniref:DUF4265 domain-containing protein n=1 Tax=Sorangium TaxID=39643 RepID=UPI0009D6511A|nr:DUF4265 domain-containing protein [Sorangium cellulosum]
MKRGILVFPLERDEEGYPPVDYERVWVTLVDENSAIIDNIPFFCRDVALGDTVRYQAGDGDELLYVSMIKRSGNSLLRVLYYENDPSELRKLLEELGCETELDASHNLIAVSVPPGDKLERVQKILAEKEAQGELGYEEAILVSSPPPPG